jgi:hypothetical protein
MNQKILLYYNALQIFHKLTDFIVFVLVSFMTRHVYVDLIT